MVDQVPGWVPSAITNGANIAGASQPALTIGVHAVADKIKGTNNVDLKDPKTIATAISSTGAGISAVGEALGYPTSLATAIFNGIVIAIGVHDTADTLSVPNQAALQNTPEAMPMTQLDHTVVGGLETDEAGHPYQPLSINLGHQRLRTPHAIIQQQNAEINVLRRRIRQLESKN
ncbi:hypothetical protein [Pseudomonas carassii]|uniref:Uncharacterized protein n=1 Tax=Pseudomonas carassii TaxID=3115855 RepID=A0ABU7HCZ7_9PSED|nr:hypothetical protein [Pseudomonas sp. 137P]MEE1889139.1 hypothetical protein [Pseudomonas sp. 137P]